MNAQTALNLVSEVCEKYLGTLQDHKNLQEAIATLQPLIGEPKKPKSG